MEQNRWFAAEIFVVFIGVYLAFLLEGYRTEQQNEQKRQQIYSSLYTMFEGFSSDMAQSNSFEKNYSRPFLEAYENDERPRLKPLPFLGSGFSAETWSAMLQAGGIDLLDVNFILQIEFFFSNIRYLDKRLSNVNNLYNRYLLPDMNSNISTFYDTETNKIRPQYAWYLDFLNFFPSYMSNLEESSNEILSQLETKMNKQQLENMQESSVQQ